jgi:hypothetical protein
MFTVKPTVEINKNLKRRQQKKKSLVPYDYQFLPLQLLHCNKNLFLFIFNNERLLLFEIKYFLCLREITMKAICSLQVSAGQRSNSSLPVFGADGKLDFQDFTYFHYIVFSVPVADTCFTN